MKIMSARFTAVTRPAAKRLNSLWGAHHRRTRRPCAGEPVAHRTQRFTDPPRRWGDRAHVQLREPGVVAAGEAVVARMANQKEALDAHRRSTQWGAWCGYTIAGDNEQTERVNDQARGSADTSEYCAGKGQRKPPHVRYRARRLSERLIQPPSCAAWSARRS